MLSIIFPNLTQCKYITTAKEVYAVVFALEKFHPYLLGVKVTVYTYHSVSNIC